LDRAAGRRPVSSTRPHVAPAVRSIVILRLSSVEGLGLLGADAFVVRPL
jgi:hypothetical protein